MLTPDQDAGSLRMQAILEMLTALKCKMTFVADNLEYRQPYVAELQRRGVEVMFAPYIGSIAALLDVRGTEFDVIVMARHYIAIKHIEAVRAFAPHALCVFDTVDLHFLREERLAELEGSAPAKAAARLKRNEELALIRKADVTLVVSPTEKALLDISAKLSAAPLWVETSTVGPQASARVAQTLSTSKGAYLRAPISGSTNLAES